MSTKLTGYVWDGCAASGMKLSSVAIMARLADFSNDEGVCWPSIETIARQIGAGMSTVRTANDDVVKPVKEQAENKIDGAVALIMAVGRAMLYEKEDTLSDHIESYGIRSL